MVKEYVKVKDEKIKSGIQTVKLSLIQILKHSAYKKRKQTYAKIEKIDQLEDKVKSIENKIDEVLTTLKKVIINMFKNLLVFLYQKW